MRVIITTAYVVTKHVPYHLAFGLSFPIGESFISNDTVESMGTSTCITKESYLSAMGMDSEKKGR